MTKKLLLVMDLGCLRAYRMDYSVEGGHGPRLELVDEFNSEHGHNHPGDLVTDSPGRFPRGAGPKNVMGDMSSGERNDLQLEERRRMVREIGGHCEDLLKDKEVESCYFAAASEINHQLLDTLSPQARKKITRNVTANLVKTRPPELLAHF
jgi:hypothetical protein